MYLINIERHIFIVKSYVFILYNKIHLSLFEKHKIYLKLIKMHNVLLIVSKTNI